MGEIIFWGLIRAAVVIPLVWMAGGRIAEHWYWLIGLLSVYLLVLHPAIYQYQSFVDKNKGMIEGLICSKCRHFDPSAVLCMKHDKHPSRGYIPCDGIHWEPDDEKTLD